ncbi:MAG: hypothetical protein H6767_01370 [Candidatus Peribacteria bacterium]|nr:MAG: hypothetical protein H6767_01370 [Candidatus Peribacteria bacterium]
MQPIYNPHTNVWVIDDSYNGNLEGVKSTVTFLKNIQIPGRKLYLSP